MIFVVENPIAETITDHCQPAISKIDLYVTVVLNVITDLYLMSIPLPVSCSLYTFRQFLTNSDDVACKHPDPTKGPPHRHVQRRCVRHDSRYPPLHSHYKGPSRRSTTSRILGSTGNLRRCDHRKYPNDIPRCPTSHTNDFRKCNFSLAKQFATSQLSSRPRRRFP